MSIDQNRRLATGSSRITRAIKSGFAALALTSVTALTIVGVGCASAATFPLGS